MKWSTLKYLFKEGIIGLWRNRTMAVASIGTIVLCLLILGMSYGVGTNIDYLIEQIETKFGITAYIKEGLTELEILNLRYEVEQLEDVASVTYISKEEALKNFSADNEDESLFEMFKEDNPLPASLEITTVDIKNQGQLIERLNNIEGIDETVYFQNETQTFINIRNTVNYICYGILICLIVVGLLLMSNTIKLTVYIRKREINIMKYVGATDSFIRVPFLIEGMLVGFIGALISILMVTFAYDWISEKAANVSGVLAELSLVPTAEIISSLIPMYLALGIGIGLIGSMFAIHKHLKV
ncbi:MAG: permease-like cell division protein FtsX [Candidatus Cellulosilyticum pullistercoris]|uniref:Cell division protein FtsX n=1 Tax=Candidatus Cellulosilyticum pullistercoris TaxID=2838521 RepID=A0A9E2NLW7_9FIRM|nr:permease-like cell division protein FtsX [Candidatus Cellulosilyticum pullistercoris]